MVRLPVLHEAIVAGDDRVRCEAFSTILSARACAERGIARKSLPGRKARRTGPALHAPCTRCALGAVARARLAITTPPAPVEDLGVARIVLDETPPSRAAARPLTAKEKAFLVGAGWTEAGRFWLDQHGTPLRPEAALELAHRDRVYLPRNIGSGRRAATSLVVVRRRAA